MKSLCSIIVAIVLCTANASAQQQKIAPKDTDIRHIETLLKLQNSEVLPFDISSLLEGDVVYNIEYFVNEYSKGGKLLNKFSRPTLNTFFEVEESGTKAQYHANEVSLYFYTSQNDSTTMMSFEIKDLIALPHRLRLRPLSQDNQRQYSYFLRPFKIKEFRAGVEIPLALYGSAWFDHSINGYRFCGESEIDPDITSEILQHSPHYFIIGVRFMPTDQKEVKTNYHIE